MYESSSTDSHSALARGCPKDCNALVPLGCTHGSAERVPGGSPHWYTREALCINMRGLATGGKPKPVWIVSSNNGWLGSKI